VGQAEAGAYVLRLETKRGIVQGVGVFESATEVRTSGTTAWETARQSGFVIHRETHGPNGGWSFSVFYEDISRQLGVVTGPQAGEGSSKVCHMPASVPLTLYEEVLRILKSARRHLPATPGALLAYC
jgi:hypothetical protein